MLPHPSPNSYDDVLKRIIRGMRKNNADGQILALLTQMFEKELNRETAVLSRLQRKRLLREAAEALFNDVFGKMGDEEE